MWFRIIFMFLFVQASVFAGSVINVKTTLKQAKVFLSGVELSQSASLKVPAKGEYEIVFEGLASGLNEQSLQVSAKGDAIILSAKSRINYLKSQSKNDQVISLEDSLKALKYDKSNSINERDVFFQEIELLNSNKVLSGKDKVVTVQELQKMAKFYRERLATIKKEILKIDLSMEEIEKDIKRITSQLNELNKKRNKPVNEVIVSIVANSPGKIEFEISYLNFNAGWNPSYDIRAKDILNPVILNYNADVWQNTGFDWNDVQIVLSTRNPREGGNKPELFPWYLDFINEYYRGSGIAPYSMKKLGAKEEKVAELAESASLDDFIEINETQLSVEFVAGINYSIPSDAKPHSVALREYSMPARYEYYAAPKLDPDAFLVASIDDWKNLNLLPGEANIYFENSFVGKSTIGPFITEKELIISLGRDKNVIIERKLLKDFTEDKFLSSDIERQMAYEIKIKNNKNSDIKLIMEDQIPISKNEDISVKLINDGGAAFDKLSGKLKWEINLKAEDSIDKKFVFSVRYPQDKRINNF